MSYRCLMALVSTFAGLAPAYANDMLSAQTGTASASAETVRRKAPQDALAVVDFWREAGPNMWFAKDPAFDRRFRERFLTLHEAAARGELKSWLETADGALAL